MNTKIASLAIVLIFSGLSAVAQVKQGNVLAGGSMSLQSAKETGITSTAFEFSPGFGYFFADKFAAGVKVGYTSLKVKDMDAITDGMIGPFVRYYLLDADNKVNLMVDGHFLFGSAKMGSESVNQNMLGAMAGPVFFLNKHTALEVLLGYSSTKIQDFTDRTNTVSMSVGFQIHLGNGKGK
jgi:hypothetical protein